MFVGRSKVNKEYGMNKLTFIKAILILYVFVGLPIAKGNEDWNSEVIKALNSPSLNTVIEEIKRYKNSNQIAMDSATFANLIKERKLNSIEINFAYKELIKSQDPIISKEQLKELYNTKIESITSFDCQYSSTLKEKDKVTFRKNRFAIDGEKMFSEINEKIEGDNLSLIKRGAFDGITWRHLQTIETTKFIGEVSKNSKDSIENEIYQENDFLKLCSLRKTPENIIKLPAYDLVHFLEQEATMVQEMRTSEDGDDCLVVTDGANELILDVNKDFSLKKARFYRIVRDTNGFSTREIIFESIISDFINCGNGIWLPKKIVVNDLANERSEIIEVLNLKVNSVLEEELFKNIFPQGTVINDLDSKLLYVLGYPNSVEKEIDDLLISENLIASQETDFDEKEKKTEKVIEKNPKVVEKTENVATKNDGYEEEQDVLSNTLIGVSLFILICGCAVIILKMR